MSEVDFAGQDLSPSHNQWHTDQLFIEEYQLLNKLFPDAVHAEDRTYEINGRNAHEFILRVGEPMDASSIFGGGRSLEVGGPSPYAELKTVKGEFRPTIVTNIIPGEGVDQIADAAALEFPDNSFKAVLAMALPIFNTKSSKPEPMNLRPRFIREAYRVLEPGGMLLMEGAKPEDLVTALDEGFAIEQGNGCIRAHMAAMEGSMDLARRNRDLISMNLEILLHK